MGLEPLMEERARRQRPLRVALLLQAIGLLAMIAVTVPEYIHAQSNPRFLAGLAFLFAVIAFGPTIVVLLLLGGRWRGAPLWPLVVVAVIDAAAIAMATLLVFPDYQVHVTPLEAAAPALLLLPALATLALGTNLLRPVPWKPVLAVCAAGCLPFAAYLWLQVDLLGSGHSKWFVSARDKWVASPVSSLKPPGVTVGESVWSDGDCATDLYGRTYHLERAHAAVTYYTNQPFSSILSWYRREMAALSAKDVGQIATESPTSGYGPIYQWTLPNHYQVMLEDDTRWIYRQKTREYVTEYSVTLEVHYPQLQLDELSDCDPTAPPPPGWG